MTSHKSQDALRTCGSGSLIPFLLKFVVVQEILSLSERTLLSFFFGLSWPNQGSRYPRVWFGGTVGRKWNEIIRGHHPSWPLPDGLMVLETETQKALGGPGTTPAEGGSLLPAPRPSLSPPPSAHFPGYPPLITRGGLLHKGAIFSSLFFWLLYSEVWTTGTPHLCPPSPAKCTGGPRQRVPSSLLRQGVTEASGRLQWGAAERKRAVGERLEKGK